jgi:hypothetical protein
MKANKQSRQLVSTCEAARRLGLRPFRLREMQRNGEGPEFKGKGRGIRYSREALKTWVRETLCVSANWFDP